MISYNLNHSVISTVVIIFSNYILFLLNVNTCPQVTSLKEDIFLLFPSLTRYHCLKIFYVLFILIYLKK